VKAQLINIKKVYSNQHAFDPVTHEGNVITWSLREDGGDSSIVKLLLINIKDIYSTNYAFA